MEIFFGSIVIGCLVFITLSIGSISKDLYQIRKILERKEKEK